MQEKGIRQLGKLELLYILTAIDNMCASFKVNSDMTKITLTKINNQTGV